MMMSGDKIRRNGVLYNGGGLVCCARVSEKERERERDTHTIMCMLRVNCKWGDDGEMTQNQK